MDAMTRKPRYMQPQPRGRRQDERARDRIEGVGGGSRDPIQPAQRGRVREYLERAGRKAE